MSQKNITPAASSEQERDVVRRAVLQACLDESKTMNEILALPEVAAYQDQYGQWNTRNIIYALTDSGILFRRGASRDAIYRTTERGRKFIPLLEPDPTG